MTPPPIRIGDNRPAAIAMVLSATMAFPLSDFCSKVMLATATPIQTSWLRCVVFALIAVPFAYIRLGPTALHTRRVAAQFWRGALAQLSSIAFIIGLSRLTLAENAAINFSWPLVATALSALVLGETAGGRRWVATAIGFIGVIVILRPGASFQPAALISFSGALFWASAIVLTRRMILTERPETTLAWTALVSLVAMSVLLPFDWRPPTARETGLAILIGLLSGLGHGLFVFAFQRAGAATLAPFSYMQLVFTTLLGVIGFNQIPDRWSAIGGTLIVLSGVYTAHYERMRAHAERREAAQRSAARRA